MADHDRVPLDKYVEYEPEEMIRRAEKFYADMRRRRTVRDFSDKPVDRKIIEQAILAAGTAPNGANMQPWHFVVISDPEIKRRIRHKAEKIEKEFYERRAPQYWLDALAPLGTGPNKPYLEVAPYLIAIFSRRHTILPDGNIKKHYYITESVGIATGMLITALHRSGLATLTHTPNPMGFLRDILGRPKEETPFLLLVTGYPAVDATVPTITKKSLEEIASFM